jgi:hypothetical protein
VYIGEVAVVLHKAASLLLVAIVMDLGRIGLSKPQPEPWDTTITDDIMAPREPPQKGL